MSETENVLKVTLIGDAAVGKSSVLLKYIDDTFADSYVCTIGVDFKVKTLDVDGTIVKLQIWDTAGQERFKPITNCYFRGSNGCLAIFDLTNRESFDNIAAWVADYRENSLSESNSKILLVGNKADAVDVREVSLEEAEALARSLQCEYFEVSAKTSVNIRQVFYRLAQIITNSQGKKEEKGEVLGAKVAKKTGCCK